MTGPDNIWNMLPMPALIVDSRDRIVGVNSIAENFAMTSARALQGEVIWDRISIDAPLEEAFARARANSTPLFVNDVDVGTSHTVPVQCNIQIAPVTGQAGHMMFLISPRELAGQMLRSEGVKSSAKSAIGMAEMLAHEIKNPLAGISGAAQLLSMGLSTEDQELTDLIVEETRRVVKLLEQVEQFGNLSAPQMKAVNIHDILDRARRSAMLGFGAHMAIVEEYDPSLPMALGDADQLLQVVLNLLKNASEASDKNGKITIKSFYEHGFRLRKQSGSGQALPLQIEIIDDGPGLPQDIKGDIFDPFVSGRENGTGLGLALVSKIMSDHGGWIAVDSIPGQTVFRLSLARAPLHLIEPEEA